MTLLVSIFGIAGRFAGDLLTSALGWASSLLFGRVPRSHQVILAIMMAGSFLWLVVGVALLLPSVGSLLLSATPHPPFVDHAWLGVALLVAVIVLPLLVGLAGYLVPAAGDRPAVSAIPVELLRGYILAPLISGLLLFLAAVGIARKARSKRHGWSDAHVPIVVQEGGYEQLVTDMQEALASAGLSATARDAPSVLAAPGWLLTRAAGSNVRKLRPDRLMTLDGPDLTVGVYPSDIAISGTTGQRTRARAAILSRLTTSAVHLTMSAEAQEVEDRLRALAATRGTGRHDAGPAVRAGFDAIDASLLELAVPSDEWDILYRLRVQIERDLLAGVQPGSDFPGHGAGSGMHAPRRPSERASTTVEPVVA
jgi:hypothetical protein